LSRPLVGKAQNQYFQTDRFFPLFELKAFQGLIESLYGLWNLVLKSLLINIICFGFASVLINVKSCSENVTILQNLSGLLKFIYLFILLIKSFLLTKKQIL